MFYNISSLNFSPH